MVCRRSWLATQVRLDLSFRVCTRDRANDPQRAQTLARFWSDSTRACPTRVGFVFCVLEMYVGVVDILLGFLQILVDVHNKNSTKPNKSPQDLKRVEPEFSRAQ